MAFDIYIKKISENIDVVSYSVNDFINNQEFTIEINKETGIVKYYLLGELVGEVSLIEDNKPLEDLKDIARTTSNKVSLFAFMCFKDKKYPDEVRKASY